MFCEVVAARERLLADGTSVRLDAEMGPTVARKLVATREAPLTIGPIANVGLLARVTPQMGLQVAPLQVGLVAARVGTHEDALLAGEQRLGRLFRQLVALLLFQVLLNELTRTRS